VTASIDVGIRDRNNPLNGESQQIVFAAAKTNDWCLCVFFSVDIEGATAYKTEMRIKKRDDEDWCYLFDAFYADFPKRFFGKYNVILRRLRKVGRTIKRPVLWKFVGDEILFYAPLTDSRQTIDHLYAFYQTIINYNTELKSRGVKVKCKGTMWIAGFPVNNRIILPPKRKKRQNRDQPLFIVDFLGSSIDCGFRLTKFASPRRLVVSLDLIWIIAALIDQIDEQETPFEFIRSKIKYAGRHTLKGVFSGQPYPVFWVDTVSKPNVEDKWTGLSLHCECEDIVRFCKDLLPQVGSDNLIKPFIFGDTFASFDVVADGFEKQRRVVIEYKESLYQKVNSDPVSLLNEESVIIKTRKIERQDKQERSEK
jgi:hypothetical protein